MKRLLPVFSLIVLAQPALAQTVTDTDFLLTINGGSSNEMVESTTLIPLLEGACYEWRLKLAKTKDAVDITEVFTLPTAPAGWGTPGDNVTISDDLKTATSTMSLVPEGGWIGHGWCVAAGDPSGDHTIVVKSGDKVLGEFSFVVEEM